MTDKDKSPDKNSDRLDAPGPQRAEIRQVEEAAARDEPSAPGAGPSNSATERNAEARARFYEARFGKPRMFWQENEAESPTIHVVAYAPSQERDRDYYTIVTSGMSDSRMPIPGDVDPSLARAELLLYALPTDVEPNPPHPPWFVSVLHALAHMPWRFNTWLGESHTIPNGDPPAPFVEGSPLTTALLLPPIFEPPEFANGLLLAGEPVHFLWLGFITTSECDFKLKDGYEALMRKFEEANFPHVVIPHRSSVV